MKKFCKKQTFCKCKAIHWRKTELHNSAHSLGQADVTLRHVKGKTAENTAYACALPSAHGDTHGTKGKKGMIYRMSADQANAQSSRPRSTSLFTFYTRSLRLSAMFVDQKRGEGLRLSQSLT